jgi:hypothetical protein
MSYAKFKLLVFCAVLIILISSCSKDPNALSADAKSAARKSLDALQKLKASSDVGVNKMQYGNLLIEAKAAVNQAVPKLPDNELKKEIQAAMEAYADVSEAWDAFEGEELLNIKDFGQLTPNKRGQEIGVLLRNKYKLKVYPVKLYGKQVSEDKALFIYLNKSETLSTIWQEAEKHLNRAESLMPK